MVTNGSVWENPPVFEHGGYYPEGINVDGPSTGNRSDFKVWDFRQFLDYDDQMALDTRNFKAVRCAHTDAELKLDLNGTIASVAQNTASLFP